MTYSLFILLYQLAFSCFLPFSPKARKRYKGIKNIRFPEKHKKRIWMHCASAGEYEQCIPLIREIRKNSDTEICISFFSPSGMEYYQLNPLADFSFYLPFDTKKNAKKIVGDLQPDYVIWVKYEFWQNIIRQLALNKIPCDLIFTDLKHIEKKVWIERNRIYHLLPYFNKIYSTSGGSNYTGNYTLINDGKWSQSLQNIQTKFHDSIIEEFTQNANTIILGSAHYSDAELLARFLSQNSSDLKWLIVPHETDDQSIRAIQKLFPSSALLSGGKVPSSVLIIDKTGILKYVYRFADIAWIGGGFDKSIHNALEAAAYKIPLISGPQLKGMNEAEILREKGVLHVFENDQELKTIIEQIFATEPEFYHKKIESLYNKNAVDNYSISIIDDMNSHLFPVN